MHRNNHLIVVIIFIIFLCSFNGVIGHDIDYCNDCECKPRHQPHSIYNPKTKKYSSSHCHRITDPKQCTNPHGYGPLCLWICDGVELEHEMYSDVTFLGFDPFVNTLHPTERVNFHGPRKPAKISNEWANMNDIQYIENMAVYTKDLCSGALYELSLNQQYFKDRLHNEGQPRRLVGTVAGALTAQEFFQATGMLEFDLPDIYNPTTGQRQRRIYEGTGTLIANQDAHGQHRVHIITAAHNVYDHAVTGGRSANYRFWPGLNTQRTRTDARMGVRPRGTPKYTQSTRAYYAHYSTEQVRRQGIVARYAFDWAIVSFRRGDVAETHLARVGIWAPAGGAGAAGGGVPNMKMATYDFSMNYQQRFVNLLGLTPLANTFQAAGIVAVHGMSGSGMVSQPAASRIIYGVLVGEDANTPPTNDYLCRITRPKFDIILRETGLQEAVGGGVTAANRIYDEYYEDDDSLDLESNENSRSIESISKQYHNNNDFNHIYDENFSIIKAMAFIDVILVITVICLSCACIICISLIVLVIHTIVMKYSPNNQLTVCE